MASNVIVRSRWAFKLPRNSLLVSLGPPTHTHLELAAPRGRARSRVRALFQQHACDRKALPHAVTIFVLTVGRHCRNRDHQRGDTEAVGTAGVRAVREQVLEHGVRVGAVSVARAAASAGSPRKGFTFVIVVVRIAGKEKRGRNAPATPPEEVCELEVKSLQGRKTKGRRQEAGGMSLRAGCAPASGACTLRGRCVAAR
eukprot:366063-Chlamydomonas_euryale.AAC.3